MATADNERAETVTGAFELTGGHIALDFANTVESRPTGEARDRLAEYADLVRWSEQAGLLNRKEATTLRELADRHPRAASQVLGRARVMRESIYALFSAVAHGGALPAAALERLNEELPLALSRSRVKRSDRGAMWGWSDEVALDRMLWPVVRGAADLLTAVERDRVRECAADSCGWLFLDGSRNRSRRWCDMSVCGNRNKVRRFRATRRG